MYQVVEGHAQHLRHAALWRHSQRQQVRQRVAVEGAQRGTQQTAAGCVSIDVEPPFVALGGACTPLAGKVDAAGDKLQAVLHLQCAQALDHCGDVGVAKHDGQRRAAPQALRRAGHGVHASDMALVHGFVQLRPVVVRIAAYFDAAVSVAQRGFSADVQGDVSLQRRAQFGIDGGVAQLAQQVLGAVAVHLDAQSGQRLRHLYAYRPHADGGHAWAQRGLFTQGIGGEHAIVQRLHGRGGRTGCELVARTMLLAWYVWSLTCTCVLLSKCARPEMLWLPRASVMSTVPTTNSSRNGRTRRSTAGMSAANAWLPVMPTASKVRRRW